MGRFAEAAAESELAQQLDPTRINYIAVRALHYYLEHRFDDAVAEGRRAIERDPTTYLAWLYVSASYAALGKHEDGLAAGHAAGKLTGGHVPDWFVLGLNYALMNDRARTERVLKQLRTAAHEHHVDPFLFVALYAYLGDKRMALDSLERAYEERSYWLPTMKVHPVVDSLRGEPRFEEMMRRMKLD
jgi:tetratricopeptide (TPR) repeat protein